MRVLLLFLCIFGISAAYTQEIISPNKKIKIVVSMKKEQPGQGQAYFKVLYKKGTSYVEALSASPLGIQRTDQQFVSNLKLLGESKPVLVHDKYEMLAGKRKSCENFGVEKVFHFQNSSKQPLDIAFRAYNDGVAFRYIFPKKSDSIASIIDEATAYAIPAGTSRWMQPFQQSYEDFYPLNTSGTDGKNNHNWAYPALVKVTNEPLWMLITEAGITKQNCAAKLNNQQNAGLYKVSYPPAKKTWNKGAVSSLPWKSQWHVLVIGGLSDVVESTLVTDVSEPVAIKDTDWIKPGSAAWVYWAYNHGSKDYKKVIEYIDLAAKMNWPYVLIDWEWDVMSNGGNLNDALRYANGKNIKALLWYNSGTDWLAATPVDRLLTAEKREKEFSWLNEIGVVGVKVDFFGGDQQEMMKYYIDILKDAARHHLLVNFHGATLPRGWARTYPNLMTTEAVYGAEWYNNKNILTDKAAAHNTTLSFTRNVVGSMDYTPVTFSNSQHPHITSYGHELALSVVFESGLQHMADRPQGYLELPDEVRSFLKTVPTAWDETRLLDGYPGRDITIARRKGRTWYVGGINGEINEKQQKIKLPFLEKGIKYTLTLIADGQNDKEFSTKSLQVDESGTFDVKLLGRGGFVATLTPVN